MRLKEFQEFLDKDGINLCVMFDSDPAIFYFAGIELEKCILFIPRKGYAELVVSELEVERARRFSRISNMKVFSRAFERDKIVANRLKGLKRGGINKESITLKNADFLKGFNIVASFADVSEAISSLRQVKTKAEVGLIREACRRTDKIMGKCISSFDFRTELDVKNFLEGEVRMLGDSLAFQTIVASGKNASMPHYFGNGRLQKGFCVIDFGIRHRGYCSDVTRTIHLGRPSQKEVGLYNLVMSAQQKAIDAVRSGISAAAIDAVARNALGRHKSAFLHGLGHHIGIEVHDSGFRISPNSKGMLMENMAVTIEPGIYYSGRFGIRIEDDVLVRKNRCEVMTKTDKELIVVE